MIEKRVEAVERALSILEAFSEERKNMSLAELADETGLYKSTILRLIGSLERFGYMMRDEDGKYRLGPSLWRLGSIYRRNFDLGEIIRPELRSLVKATRETASFYVLEQGERVCLYRENSPNPIRHHLEEGVRLSLSLGASGRVLMAYGLNDEDALGAMLASGGYISVGERHPEIAAVAMPVFGHGGDLRGALTVSGLLSRFTAPLREEALKQAKAASARLSKLI